MFKLSFALVTLLVFLQGVFSIPINPPGPKSSGPKPPGTGAVPVDTPAFKSPFVPAVGSQVGSPSNPLPAGTSPLNSIPLLGNLIPSTTNDLKVRQAPILGVDVPDANNYDSSVRRQEEGDSPDDNDGN